ncbi:hypothetical protein RND81_08G194900 [Saponaria officinalis]|uniref:Aminotransferase-like plant mobile domain-containing protein n=1 Tax=Saponaria officinalis TaxID=3572 RepID=A0AAW1JB42_SAPOF
MGVLEENRVIESAKITEFGDSEAAKLAELLHDHEQSVEFSLQQEFKIESQYKNYARLGPCFKPEKVEEVIESLKLCFPSKFTKPPFLNEPEKLACHWVRSSNKPTNGWTCSIDTRPWFDRLSSRHDSWKKLRIYEFLRLSTYPRFPFYDALSAGLLCCWNPCLNVFVTGQGFRTITLEDVAFITGLSPSGIDLPTQSLIDGAIDMEKIHPWKTKPNMSFSPVADYYNPARNKSLSADISRKEEVLFINFAFCKMMMFPSCNVNKTFLKLAANIEASGLDESKASPLCLGPLFLGQVYRCLYRLRTQEKIYTAGGPVWFISLWGLFYFPFLAKEKGYSRLDYEELEPEFDKPTVVPVNECCCYGEVAIHSVSPVIHLSFEDVLKGLLLPRELSQPDWNPFCFDHETSRGIPLYLHNSQGSLIEDTKGEWMERAAPLWLLNISRMYIREQDQRHWLSVFQCRDLMCLEPKGFGVEAYNPNLVARQFGMTQGVGVPYYKTLNRPWGSRSNILDIAPKSGDNRNVFSEKWVMSLYNDALSSSSNQIIPWSKCIAVDSGYELWWADFRHRCVTSWTDAVITLIEHVQGRPRIDQPLSTTQASSRSSPNRKNTGAQTTKTSSQSKAFSQIENSGPTIHVTRGQKRKTEKTSGDITSSKKTIIEKEAEEPDDAIVTLMEHIQRLPRIDHTSTAHVSSSPNSENTGAGTTLVVGLSQALSQPLRTSLSKKGTVEEGEVSDDDILLSTLRKHAIRPHFVPLNSLTNGSIKRDTNTKMNPTLQNDQLNNQKKEVEREGSESYDNEQDNSRAVVEVLTPDPEDSLEPPHEMVRGLGSPCLNDAFSVPSEDIDDECLDMVAVNPSCSSSLQADDDPASVEGKPIEEAFSAHDDVSRVLVIHSSSMPDILLRASSPEGVAYTPDKALAEVNSVVTLIEDTLRPFPVSSAFDAEKEKAEEIVVSLQSNMKDLSTYANLADQIHKLLSVSPPQFRPILTHYQTSFLSLRDQLRNIREEEDTMAYNTSTLNDLSTVARDLRDRLETSQGRIDQLRAQCTQYDKEIDEMEVKLVNLKQLRESKREELSIEEQKFGEFSSTWSNTIPSLQKVAQTMVSAHQTKAQWECTLKTIKDNVHSFVGLLKTM